MAKKKTKSTKKYLLQYGGMNGGMNDDPIETFTTLEAAKKRAEELYTNGDIDNASDAKLYEIVNVKTLKITANFV